MNKKPKKYTCKFCGKKHSSFIMADLCLQLDLKQLENGDKLKKLKK